jgi:hypothetical protein
MREDLKIECRMKESLEKEFGKPRAQEIFSDYVQARKYVYTQIADEIKTREPNFPDHGPRHIDNVLENIDNLLGNTEISAANIYILCISAVFHDVGNLYGRQEHNKKIDEIYSCAKGNPNNIDRQEQKAIHLIAGAHTGQGRDGSIDSLKDLPEDFSLFKKQIFPQKNAAVLRLADELAEGPQRTSLFMQTHGGYAPDSLIYHHYAKVVQIQIDRNLGRISAHYNINLVFNHSVKIDTGEDFVEFRDFIFKRFNKLDQERKYCKHYCDWLNPFKKSVATLDFFDGNHLINHDLPPIELTDLVLPKCTDNNILKNYPQYDTEAILKNLKDGHKRCEGCDDRI